MLYVAALIIFLLAWVIIGLILNLLFNKEKPIEKLKYVDEEDKLKETFKNTKKNKASILKTLSTFVPKFSFSKNHGKKLEMELVRADIPINVQELFVIKLLSSSALAFLTFALSKDYFIVILVFILVWNLPRFIISTRKKDRVKLFDSQLDEGITIISNSLKAGYSFLQAVAVVSEETRDPFSKEFKKLLKEMSLGITEEDALKNLQNRVPSEDFTLLMNAILIQKDIGGNLSEILDNISETIMDRQKIKNELKALIAQGKMSGVILSLLPVGLGLAIYLLNRKYIILLFTSTPGIAMVVFAVISELIGILLIKKIIHIDM